MGKGSSGGKGKNLSGGGGVKVTNATDFKSMDEAKAALDDSHEDWWKNRTQEEQQMVKYYTGSGYESINSSLREGTTNYFTESKTKAITKAIQSFDLKQDIVVHRGMDLDTTQIKNLFGVSDLTKLKPGAIYKDKAFMSTSAGGKGFSGNIKIDIKVPKGKGRGAWVQPISQHKSESEFLLQRSSSLRVDGVKIIKDSWGGGMKYRLEATLVGNDVD